MLPNFKNKVRFDIVFLTIIFVFIVSVSPLKSQELSVPTAETSILDYNTKKAIIDSVSKELIRTYVFPEKAEKMVALLQNNLLRHHYDNIQSLLEFTQILTNDIYSVYRDLHIEITPIPKTTEKLETSDSKDISEEFRFQNYGFFRAEILPGNIGYLDLRSFADTSMTYKPLQQ
jgi:retinol-binding protein 3